jgi:hypothetical protein
VNTPAFSVTFIRPRWEVEIVLPIPKPVRPLKKQIKPRAEALYSVICGISRMGVDSVYAPQKQPVQLGAAGNI